MGKIYLQMYSFMDGTMNDNRENLRLAAEMGYDGVELFGPLLAIPAEELKSLLDEYHLEPISMHAPTSDMVEQLIPLANALDMKFIGIGMETMLNDDAVHAFAGKLNRLGKACAENGLTLTYHNHTQEFLPCEDKKVIDILMEETDPKYVSFELDAGWCAAAGFDPLALVEQYSGRIKLIHVKESDRVIGPQQPIDFGSVPKDEKGMPVLPEELKRQMEEMDKTNCVAGKGLVDWKVLKETADRHGCQAYIVEREYAPEGKRLEYLQADLDYYRTQI